MNGQEMKDAAAFDLHLKVGDIVEARFTNSGDYHAFKAVVTKVNEKTVRVRSLEPGKPYEGDYPNREFIIYRFWHGKSSVNNGVFPWPVKPIKTQVISKKKWPDLLGIY